MHVGVLSSAPPPSPGPPRPAAGRSKRAGSAFPESPLSPPPLGIALNKKASPSGAHLGPPGGHRWAPFTQAPSREGHPGCATGRREGPGPRSPTTAAVPPPPPQDSGVLGQIDSKRCLGNLGLRLGCKWGIGFVFCSSTGPGILFWALWGFAPHYSVDQGSPAGGTGFDLGGVQASGNLSGRYGKVGAQLLAPSVTF